MNENVCHARSNAVYWIKCKYLISADTSTVNKNSSACIDACLYVCAFFLSWLLSGAELSFTLLLSHISIHVPSTLVYIFFDIFSPSIARACSLSASIGSVVYDYCDYNVPKPFTLGYVTWGFISNKMKWNRSPVPIDSRQCKWRRNNKACNNCESDE